MVLFPNDNLDFYARGTPTINGEGIVTSWNYTFLKTTIADMQPNGPGQINMEQYGVSNLQANDRVAFVNLDTALAPIMKVVSQKTGVIYELVQDQPWNSYKMIILRPMQAGQSVD